MLTRLREKRLLWPAVMTALALPFLVGLGTWQLQRKAWKEGLITRLETRVAAAPVPLETALARWRDTGDVEYLSVATRGRFHHDKERHLYAIDSEEGPGWHVLTPLETSNGHNIVIVNRGFVPITLKDPEKRKDGQIAGDVEVVGLLRAPGGRETFAPDNDAAGNVWYWRDIDGLLRSMFENTERPFVPFFLEAKAEPANPGGWPKGGVTIVSLPNRHLEYALTWFGLAAALAAIFISYALPRLRDADA